MIERMTPDELQHLISGLKFQIRILEKRGARCSADEERQLKTARAQRRHAMRCLAAKQTQLKLF